MNSISSAGGRLARQKVLICVLGFWPGWLALALALWGGWGAHAIDFVIEAEDFNYNGGQTRPEASTMPYYGGAYAGLTATYDVDYNRGADGSSPAYRNDNRIPMTDNMGDVNRGAWDVNVNFRMGWIGEGMWFNYTRTFPSGYYKVYAALSYGDTSASAMRGSMQLVTSNPGAGNQTLDQLGTFDAPGTGTWGVNALVPMLAANGQQAVIQLSGTQTIRFTAASGDVDYYRFVPAGPPQIGQQPVSVTVIENQPATFTVIPNNEDGINYQWQSNQVSIVGATASNYTFYPRFSASGSKYRCVLSNPLGTTNSTEATLTVTRDTTKPKLVKALNLGTNTVRLTFDEGVLVPAGSAAASFALDHGASVQTATAGTLNTEILLTVSGLVFGTNYTVTVNNVTDLADIPNPIAANSQVSFISSEYAPVDIGAPGLAGSATAVPGGLDIIGGGIGVAGTADQFHFEYQQLAGNFDLAARVAGVSISDPFMRAGLMLRETLNANARFAAVFASSAQLGCFFEQRTSVGASATTTAPAGGFSVNYPFTWLRLRRVGTTLTGFAGFDGQSWVQLGSVSLGNLPSTIYFGMALTSESASGQAWAQFRDLGVPAGTGTASYTPTREPLGPSSRTTGMILSEIMYHPPARADGRNLEFVELYNARAIFEDLSGWRLAGDLDFTFPAGFQLQAGDFVVVAASPEDLKAVYGITNVMGPYTGALSNGGGTLKLMNNEGAERLSVTYGTEGSWPVAADGAGHSLVLARPSYGEDQPQAWAASERIGGSPGGIDPLYLAPERNVVINEFLAHTDEPQFDFIELYNRSNAEVDLSGCILTDSPATNRFRLADGTKVPARGFLAFDQNQLGFALSSAGETIYLISSNATRVLDAVRFGGQENGVSMGRFPDGGPELRRLQSPTQAQANAPWRREEIVINEVMYKPITDDSDDEFIELYNRTASNVDLSGWRFTEGVQLKLPANTVVPAGGCLVVARNASRMLANYPQLGSTNLVGDYSGSLANNGERVALAKPDDVVSTNEFGERMTNRIWITVAELAYAAGGRWGKWADGGGSSLELTDPNSDSWQAANWADSDETQKGEWSTVSFTGTVDQGSGEYAPNRFHILMQGAGECLIDDLEVFKPGGANLISNAGFESGATGWSLFGNHSQSAVVTSGAATGSRCLRVRSSGDGDTGINSIRTAISGLANGNTATIRAKVRWQAGWPEVLLRTRGAWIELPARMSVPKNLGTPGLPNSRLVANAGPAIFAVTHQPAVPSANQAVRVTCRVSDPDGVGGVNLRYRVDPATTLTTVAMRDDGLGGDDVAGDGIYTANLTGRSAGTLVAFRIESTDAAEPVASRVFPAGAPAQECLIRWGDPLPLMTFGQYHLWNTQATTDARNQTVALNNTYRDATLVYGNYRVIYNVGFRDKGSPYHGGSGDLTVTVPADDLLLGTQDRVFGSTGNGGSEETGLRGQVSAWIGQQMGIPYLHSHYIQVYWNGGQFREVLEDLEQPSQYFAGKWFPEGGDGDLYKVAVWFEFQDDNSGFGAVGATLEPFRSANGAYKLSRYRWNFQQRTITTTANNYTNLFDLIDAANDQANRVPRLLNLADMEEWMRIFAFHRVLGNWDSWSFSVGQNMYIIKQPGRPWKMMPWDIDFVLGLGNGPSDGLWGGQDPVINQWFDTPEFRRMLWRAYIDAVNGAMLPERYTPQIAARRAALLKNGVNLSDPKGVGDYLVQRRSNLQSQIRANDASVFAITSNGGSDFSTASPTATLTGTAPFVVKTIEVNGVPYLATWTDQITFQIKVPLTQATNLLVLAGQDRLGQAVPGATDSVTVRYTGAVPQARDFVAINEIQYDAAASGASYLELFNRSTTTAFDLTGYKLEGVGYTFPSGAIIQPNSYLVLARNRAGFAAAYGGTIPVFDTFPGSLDNDGEYLGLLQLGGVGGTNKIISDVRYDKRLPWPTNAAGFGPSLQLMDAAQDEYRVGNWAATAAGDGNQATPGRANATRQTLAPFPLVWINEVQPANASTRPDNRGEFDPWIELYNAGDSLVDLGAFYLTDSYTNLTKWQFSPGTLLGSKQFLVIYADGQAEQSGPGYLHANFRLNATNGSVALVRLQGSPAQPAVMDYLDYDQVAPDRSIGCFPDGEPRVRTIFYTPTPDGSNNPNWPRIPVVINEVQPDNRATIADPVDQQYQDWLELYNQGDSTVDLGRHALVVGTTNTSRFVIPAGVSLPSHGHLLVWADGEPAQYTPGGDLHADFALSSSGETVSLLSPDGSVLDSISFGALTNDVSFGRYPDGAEPPLVVMEQPTPRDANVLAGGNRPPVVTPPAALTVDELQPVQFTVAATDPDVGQTLAYALSLDAPPEAQINPSTGVFSWTPTEAQGPGQFAFWVRVTDSGTPPRSTTARISVTVREVNSAPVLPVIPDQSIDEGALWQVSAAAVDSDVPANHLAYALDAGAPAGLTVNSDTGLLTWTPSENQGPGQYSVTVRVADDGVPPLSASRTFKLTVREVNNPPVFDPVQPQMVDELSPLVLTVHAVDPDQPPVGMAYSLDVAPSGARINADTGAISWTPTEEQGPTNAVFVVRATERSAAALSSATTFGVSVREVNQPPVLELLADQTLQEGEWLRLTATASDPDLPAQALAFALAAGAPEGMAIDPATGFLSWQAPADAGAGTWAITVRVTDNATPPLSDARTFQVHLTLRPHVVINEIMYRPTAAKTAFVELLNDSTNTTENLSGVELLGNNLQFTFPAGAQLAPGQLVVVVQDRTAFGAAYTNQPVVGGTYTGQLGLTGDTLRLVRHRDAQTDEVLDEVAYASRLPWPAAAEGQGGSLQLIDAARDNRVVGNWAAIAGLAAGQPRELIGMTNAWRYEQTGADLGANWILPSFNDQAWPEGAALLYVEGADLPAPKNTPLQLGPMSFYFRTHFQYHGPTAGVTLRLNAVIDDAAVFYLNGQPLYRLEMPEVVDRQTPAGRTVGDAVIEGPFVVAGTNLVQGDNVLAVEVHQISTGSSDIVFGLSMEVDTGNLLPATPGFANSFAAPLPAIPPVWINEVLPNNATGLADGQGEREPWVELHNAGWEAVSLDGWALANQYTNLTAWTFPAGAVVQPGQFLVVWLDGEAAAPTAGEWHASFRLDPSAGSLALVRLQGGQPAVMDYLDYVGLAADQAWGAPTDARFESRAPLAPTPGASNLPVPVEIRFLQVSWSSPGVCTLVWTAEAGRRYGLEFKTTLNDAAWQSLGQLDASGATASFQDQNAGGISQRFYRVRLLP